MIFPKTDFVRLFLEFPIYKYIYQLPKRKSTLETSEELLRETTLETSKDYSTKTTLETSVVLTRNNNSKNFPTSFSKFRHSSNKLS